MINKIQNSVPLMQNQPKFGSKADDAINSINNLTEILDTFEDESLEPQERVSGALDLVEFKKIENDKETGKPSPFYFFLAAAGIGLSTFLGARFATNRILKAGAKLAPDLAATIAEKAGKLGTKFAKGVEKIENKGFKQIFKNIGNTVANGVSSFSKKGAESNNLVDVAGNGLRKLTSITSGLVFGTIAVKEAASDKKGPDGEGADGVADILQNPAKQKKLVNQIIITAADCAADFI